MTPQWPENGDEKPDPALEPLIEAGGGGAMGGGGGGAEGFELAEQELVDHASHGDQHSDRVIGRDALGFDSTEEDPATYGEADEEDAPDCRANCRPSRRGRWSCTATG